MTTSSTPSGVLTAGDEQLVRNSHHHLRAGATAMLPIMAAYVPFALLVGAAVADSSNPAAAWLATWAIYGGAAHLAVLDVLAQGSGWLTAVAVGVLVNARLVAYAAGMAPGWRSAPLRQRAGAAVMLTDAPWTLARARVDGHRSYYFGAASALFLGWPVLVSLGVLVGGWFSAAPVVGLLPALTLGVVVTSQLQERPVVAAAVSAAVTAALTAGLSAGISLLLCAAVGVTSGVVAEWFR